MIFVELERPKIETIILLLALFIHFSISAWFILNSPLSPIYTDWTTHLPVVKKIVETGEIPITYPLYGMFGFPRFMPITVTYPPVYFVLSGITYPFLGDKTGGWLELISSSFSIVLIYLIFKKLYNNRVGLFASIFLAISFSTKFVGWDQDLFIVFPLLLSLFLYVNFMESKKLVYIPLIALSLALAVGTKQFAWLFLFVILFHMTFYTYMKGKKMKCTPIALLFCLLIILSAPILSYQISNTGTLSTPAINGWPIIDEYVFTPKYLEMEEWQNEIDKKVNIGKLTDMGSQYYYEKYGSLSLLKNNPISFVNEQFNIFYVSKPLPLALRVISIPLFLTFLFLFGMVLFFIKLNSKTSILLLILVANIFVVIITSKGEYFLVGPFLWCLFFGLSTNSILNVIKDKKHIKVLFFVVVIIASLSSTTISIDNNQKYLNNLVYNDLRYDEVGIWVEQHSTPNDIIMEVHPAFPYYSNRTSFWDYRLFFLDKENLIYYLESYYKPKYIVINEYQIVGEMENWRNWWWIPQDSPFLKLLNDQEYFIEQYHTGKSHIYRFVKLYPRNDS